MGFGRPYNGGSRPRNAAFRVGLIAGVTTVVVHLILLLITQDPSTADGISWVISWLIMFFAAGSAANQQYAAQQQSYMNAKDGVVGAAVGAALIVVIFMWGYIILRDVLLSEPSFFTTAGILRMVLDIFIALGIGAGIGNRVAKRNRPNDY